ncbi:MAG: DUF3494 domain-containing protein [Armatimonadetes bacterium]|nr:DUF3494 domain-containing protein [Armatimonadota bacterium]
MTFALLASVWLTSCGGASKTGGRAGGLTVAVAWPKAGSRLIPANSQSVTITVVGNSAGLSAPVAQTVTGAAPTANFPGLIPGTYTVTARAYPNADGTGVLLATAANANVVVTASNTTTVNISLASQVVSVTAALNPATTDDVPADTVLATLTAWTGAAGTGSMVPISPTKVTWVSGTPTVATVSALAGNGVPVTPVLGAAASGTKQTQITGSYQEAPVSLSAAATLTVTATLVTPAVASSVPLNGATGVSLRDNITATFTKVMAPLTVVAAFTLSAGLNPIAGNVTYTNRTATFDPTGDLLPGTSYTAKITTSAQDLAGNHLLADHIWTFRTHLGPEPPTLGAAGLYSILAGSAVTNADTVANPTRIQGLIGIFPGTAVTGLPTGVVPASQIHAGDTDAQNAKAALLVAYQEAVANSLAAISLPGQVGGLTLAPGLYVSATSSGISGAGPNGILTLDAQGDSGATWIFKMGSTLITDPGTSVVLAGRAQAKNIYWQAGSSATLGTNSVFKGNILADVSITLTTGAVLEGRALTRAGAVTLDTNTLTLP